MPMRILLNPTRNQIVQSAVIVFKKMARMIVLMNFAFLFFLCRIKIVQNDGIKGRMAIN
jgi:hypothetical protein